MPTTKEITVYKYEELSETAKERAREWYRDGALGYDWWDSVYEDAATIAEILGIDLRTKRVNTVGGGIAFHPCIYFSGFSSQGDGACFEGSYRYHKGSMKEILAHAPRDEELHRIARELQQVQRKNFYALEAAVSHSGRYYHEHSTTIEVSRSDGSYPLTEAVEEVSELLRDFMRWIYRALEREYEYLMSDESVDESIIANEYEFNEDGTLA